jgi:prophage regulatory protein
MAIPLSTLKEPNTKSFESHPNGTKECFLRLKEVQCRVPWSRATIYRHINLKKFPAPYSLCGSGAVGGAVAWKESEIDAWIQSREARQ